MDATTTMQAVTGGSKEHLVDPGEVVVDAIAGAAAGAAAGALAGLPGAIVGAVIGGAIGAAAAAALHVGQMEKDRREEARDRTMGVIGGHIGEASPDAPPVTQGRFHLETLGLGGAVRTVEPAEGPIQSIDEA